MISLLQRVQLFNGLSSSDLELLVSITRERIFAPGEIVVEQNTTGDEVYIIAEGSIDVYVSGLENERTIVVLGEGQVFGEMALIAQGYRSASGRAGREGCRLLVIKYAPFHEICNFHAHVGYKIMRNLAQDLAFKMRHRNLALM